MLPAIPENYWNAKKERIKSGFNIYQELNQIIEKSKLDFLNQKEQKPDEKNKIKFIDYSINKIEKQYVKISTKKVSVLFEIFSKISKRNNICGRYSYF